MADGRSGGAGRALKHAPGGNRLRGGVLAVLLFAAAGILGCDELLPERSPGAELWKDRCADCHGRDGSGNTPRYMGDYRADLLDDTWEHGGDAGSWEMVIRDGVFGRMPANEELTREELAALVAHLRQLRERNSGSRG